MQNIRCTLGIVLVWNALLGVAVSWGGDFSYNSVQSVPKRQVLAISKRIDQLVENRLDGQKTNPETADHVFLRRVYLDIVGRIPTLEETRSFLDQPKRDRGALIDKLLDSPGYVSHQFNFWADILRIKSRMTGGNQGQPYIDYVKDSLRQNKPYDQFVRELITSEGPALERGNGATGYYLRDTGMPEDNMANTVRVFLGTRIECAQCHDHPFDTWTQREFFEMVAFTGGMRTRMSPSKGKRANDLRREIRTADADPKIKQLATNLLRPLSYGVVGGGTGLARLPDSYQYDDGTPNEIVTAKTMFTSKAIVHPEIPKARKRNQNKKKRKRQAANIPGARDIGTRQAFADWLTGVDNPLFAQVIANRMWKQAMGLGLIEPVDDINGETVASNPALMEYLTELMVDLEYDLKQFQRAIYHSKTYQRQASGEDLAEPAEFQFTGPRLRRLSAEQMWDSFLVLAVPELDTRENPRSKGLRGFSGKDIYDAYETVKDLSVDDVLDLAREQMERRNSPKKRRQEQVSMMAEAEKTNPYRQEAAEVRQKLNKLKRLRKQAQKRKNRVLVRRLQQEIAELQRLSKSIPTRISLDMVRASELPSPAPVGHFVREFGQSDRDQIQNANDEPAVSQVLSLMNGQIEKRIINSPRTVLMRNIALAKSPRHKIDVVFLSMLSRYPTSGERQLWLRAAAREPREAATDLIWTLANTNEFMFQQ